MTVLLKSFAARARTACGIEDQNRCSKFCSPLWPRSSSASSSATHSVITEHRNTHCFYVKLGLLLTASLIFLPCTRIADCANGYKRCDLGPRRKGVYELGYLEPQRTSTSSVAESTILIIVSLFHWNRIFIPLESYIISSTYMIKCLCEWDRLCRQMRSRRSSRRTETVMNFGVSKSSVFESPGGSMGRCTASYSVLVFTFPLCYFSLYTRLFPLIRLQQAFSQMKLICSNLDM